VQTQAKLNMWGNSLAIRITSAMANIAHLHKGSEVSIEANEEGISIKPLKQKARLQFSEAQLLADLSVENSGAELLASNLKGELTY
jgi:antitoxin MazE